MGNSALSRRNSLFSSKECRRSSTGKNKPGATIKEEVEPPPPLKKPKELTARQKEVLLETWKVLEADISKVGVITFISLFETHPDVQDSFMPFSGLELEELRESKQLRAHALRVMSFVQKAVARLNEPEKLETLLRDLGVKHHNYGAKPKFLDLIGPQFIQAIKPSLESRWDDEVEECWLSLFHIIVYLMHDAMNEQIYLAATKNHK